MLKTILIEEVLLLLIVDNWSFSLKLGDLMFQTANSFFFAFQVCTFEKVFFNRSFKNRSFKIIKHPWVRRSGKIRLG